MKIAHLTTVDSSLRYLLLAQLEGAVRLGHDVVGISAAGPDVAVIERSGVRFVDLAGSTRRMSLRDDLRSAAALWRILRRERPDVLHTHNPKPGLYGRVLGRVARVPRVVHTTHGLYATERDRRPKRLAVYSLEALASRFSHCELVQNPEDYELMRRYRIVARHKIELLGNGIDLVRFAPAVVAQHRADARRELGFDDAEVVVGCVARLVEEKGIPELVEATCRDGSGVRLLLVGPTDPAKADAVDAALLERALRSGAVLPGHRDDVERTYAAMDVFCLPSHREGFPRSAMEAAACGLPVVATDIRGCRQAVEDGCTGTLVPVGDPDAIAGALAAYLDPARRAAHGAAGRRLAERDFDERRVVALVLAAEGVTS